MNKCKKIVIISILLTNTHLALALSPQDNLGLWRKSSFSEQASLCEQMVMRITDKGALTAPNLCSCVSETAADGGLDFMLVKQVAAACAIQLK